MATIKEIVKDFYNLENDIFFNQLHDTGEAFYTFNENIEYQIWNHAFPYNIKTGKNEDLAFSNFIKDTISFYISKNRKPVVYLDDKYFASKLHQILHKNKFEMFDNEAWMQFKTLNYSYIPEIDITMKLVDSLEKYKFFTKAVNSSFSKAYTKELKYDFDKTFGFKHIKHFTFWHGKTLIGAGSIYHDRKTAHLHNLCVLPKYRGHGFGKSSIKHLVEYTLNELKLPIYLQCEGVSVESFYKKLGAETFYRRYGYILNY